MREGMKVRRHFSCVEIFAADVFRAPSVLGAEPSIWFDVRKGTTPCSWIEGSPSGIECMSGFANVAISPQNEEIFGYFLRLYTDPSYAAYQAGLVRWICHQQAQVTDSPIEDQLPSELRVEWTATNSLHKSEGRLRWYIGLVPPVVPLTLAARKWSSKLNRLARRRAILMHRLYYLSAVGGGWASVRCPEPCLLYAAKSYLIAQRLGDDALQARCRLYLGYYFLMKKLIAPAKLVFSEVLEFASRARLPVLEKSAVSALAQADSLAEVIRETDWDEAYESNTGSLGVDELKKTVVDILTKTVKIAPLSVQMAAPSGCQGGSLAPLREESVRGVCEAMCKTVAGKGVTAVVSVLRGRELVGLNVGNGPLEQYASDTDSEYASDYEPAPSSSRSCASRSGEGSGNNRAVSSRSTSMAIPV